jgi:hypothetical protein
VNRREASSTVHILTTETASRSASITLPGAIDAELLDIEVSDDGGLKRDQGVENATLEPLFVQLVPETSCIVADFLLQCRKSSPCNQSLIEIRTIPRCECWRGRAQVCMPFIFNVSRNHSVPA